MSSRDRLRLAERHVVSVARHVVIVSGLYSEERLIVFSHGLRFSFLIYAVQTDMLRVVTQMVLLAQM